jgi:coenzyme Q-binding protein COQ10
MPTQGEKKILPYSAAQMYDLAADVGAYPQFLPWISAARIRSRTDMGDHEIMEADLVISFKVFRERFGSKVTLWPEKNRIDTQYLDGPFKYLVSYWQFTDQDQGGCEVDFFVDFEFKNIILQKLIGVVFSEAMRRTMKAFEKRAAFLYG